MVIYVRTHGKSVCTVVEGNDQIPMTNDQERTEKTHFIGHWGLVIGHSKIFPLRLTPCGSFYLRFEHLCRI